MDCIDEKCLEIACAVGAGLLDFCKSAFPQLVAAFAGVGFAFYFNWIYLKSQKKQIEIE